MTEHNAYDIVGSDQSLNPFKATGAKILHRFYSTNPPTHLRYKYIDNQL